MMAAVNFASADTVRGITNLDFVNIGHAGNPGDTRATYPDIANPTGGGAVGYNYRIGKYEVTNAQWNAFTAAAGAPTGSDSGYEYGAVFTGAQQPTNVVSWYGVAQFCNYLTSGDKSKGAYLFSGNNTNPGAFLEINRDAAISSYGIAYVIPTVDEWYKAAYYTGSGYSTYAFGTNIEPIAGVNSDYAYSSPWGPWDVGTGTMEQNGTYDMMGNVSEWNETTYYGDNSFRILRGGSYLNSSGSGSSYSMIHISPTWEYYDIGFRVAEVPEPATLFLLTFGGLILRKRKA